MVLLAKFLGWHVCRAKWAGLISFVTNLLTSRAPKLSRSFLAFLL